MIGIPKIVFGKFDLFFRGTFKKLLILILFSSAI